MKNKNYILKIGVALTLLLFSVATRSNMFATEQSFVVCAVKSSNNHAHEVISPIDMATYLNLIYGDDSSDDDDHHAFLLRGKKDRIPMLYHDAYYSYSLHILSSSVFFSSDTSPPLA